MLYFQNERRYGARNVYNDLFLGNRQPGVDKSSGDLAILILEFDDVVVKTLFHLQNIVMLALRNITRDFAASYSLV